MKRLKVVQAGVGAFGAYRRERMRETGLFEMLAACDWNPEALARCEEEDGARPVGSYEELLDTGGAEAVIICTGAKFHAGQIVQAAERGLHVFVEKPLCSTLKEMEEIQRARDKSGVVIAVGHTDHHGQAASRTTARLLREGNLGTTVAVEYTTAHAGALNADPNDWRFDPEKNPGGMLFQCGVHGLHELMFYFGPISEVSCCMRYDVHTTRTADAAACHLKFASGVVGTLNAYHVTPYRHTLNIFGTRSNLYREDVSFGEPSRLFRQTTYLDGKKEPLEPIPLEGEDDDSGALRSFYRAVREGGEASPSLLDGMRAVAVVFAADESARTGRTVEVRLP